MSSYREIPDFYPPSKSDKEYYAFMIKKSPDARECIKAYSEGELFKHAACLMDLFKIGYSREEIYAFLRVMYENAEMNK